MSSSASGASGASSANVSLSLGSILLPLALAQFIASYACSNMNVAISDIANDLGTTVIGVQTVITFFTLTMAALMIPGSKLTDIWGRKFCFILGLIIYGAGAVIASLAPVVGVLAIGYSLLEGIGSALMIPPIYIFATVSYDSIQSRAKAFGIVSAAAAVGAAAGPLIGGVITTGISWRASFIFQALVVGGIILLGRQIVDPGVQGARPPFDIMGAILSAVGLFFVVYGVLQSGTYGWFSSREAFTVGNVTLIQQGGISPVWLFVAIGAVFLLWFYLHIRSRERANKLPLIATRIFRNHVSNLGLVTQVVQWLILQGCFFVISVFIQEVRGYNAIQTGLLLTPATIGILIAGGASGRLARRRAQRTLIWAGFATTIGGVVLLLFMASATSSVWTFVPGLLLIGLGVGVMLTSSVNVVQSAFSERDQGEISGLSRSVSNLGSSLGTAIAGSVLVITTLPGNADFAAALIIMAVIACLGLGAAILLPRQKAPAETATQATATA